MVRKLKYLAQGHAFVCLVNIYWVPILYQAAKLVMEHGLNFRSFTVKLRVITTFNTPACVVRRKFNVLLCG